MLQGHHAARDKSEMHNQEQSRSSAPALECRRARLRSEGPMRRGLLPQTCSGLGLALLLAFGVMAIAIPVLLIRLIVAVAVDGITWK